eukprot:CAMPEP_0168318526 /NCGR_PEP_ID=MMETSP0213-20121227/530_1 /TAXON_ID=151035 /ORGANISM="Euplotes harpa, Strain FSP1.4" /LENGTH=175 /DNA_ID=CAMNT_0008319607 /DNA_START=481 /DNA_END=1008 /DNA_ORIENTATION=-
MVRDALRTHRLHEPFQFIRVRVGRVVALEDVPLGAVVLIRSPAHRDEDRWLLLVELFNIHGLPLLFGLDINPAFLGVGRVELGLEAEQFDFPVSVLIDDDLGLELSGEDLFLAEEIDKEVHPVVQMLLYDPADALVRFLPLRMVFDRVCKRSVHDEVVDLHRTLTFFIVHQLPRE